MVEAWVIMIVTRSGPYKPILISSISVDVLGSLLIDTMGVALLDQL